MNAILLGLAILGASPDIADMRPLVVLVESDGCSPCRVLSREVSQAVASGNLDVAVLSVSLRYPDADADNHRRMGDPRVTPTILIYQPIAKFVGYQSIAKIKEAIGDKPAVKVPVDELPPDIDSSITPIDGLIAAGRAYSGALVCYSPKNPILMQSAQDHAEYQAKWQRQGHQNWEQRKMLIQAKVPGNVEEICAESWPPAFCRDPSPEGIGREMFASWRASPGHWSVASRLHGSYGAGIARGSNGVWYATIQVSDSTLFQEKTR